MVSDTSLLFSALATGAIFKYGAMFWIRRRRFDQFKPYGTISSIITYPVKSCRGIQLQTAQCEPVGICYKGVYDRSFVFVDHTGLYVTQRQKPKMAFIQPTIDGDWLILDAPNMPRLHVSKLITPNSGNIAYCKLKMFVIKSVDCGDEAADWISRYLDTPGMRLLYLPRQLNPRDLMQHYKPWQHKAIQGDRTHYSDFCSYMITSDSSLAEVNKKLPRPVKMTRFRPNFVFTGAPAFVEMSLSRAVVCVIIDHFLIAYNIAKQATARCVFVTVDPDTGVKDEDGEPLKTLEKFYSSPAYDNRSLFGVNSTCDDSGFVSVGDTIKALV